jgi:hypothetical protein
MSWAERYAHVLPLSHPLAGREKDLSNDSSNAQKKEGLVQLGKIFPVYVINTLSDHLVTQLETMLASPHTTDLIDLHHNLLFTNQSTEELLKQIVNVQKFDTFAANSEEIQQNEQQIRPYVPKYNTFKANKNEDMHIEKGDERFESANSTVPILRSKGLTTEFRLRLREDVQPFVTEERQSWGKMIKKSKTNDLNLENFVQMDRWNEDQLRDITRQLHGENEKITLTSKSFL